MCTAVTYRASAHYFGRNFELGCSYGEGVTVTPRNFPLPFRKMPALTHHYALIGMAVVQDGYPLYYYTTHENRSITAVDMHCEDLDGCALAFYPKRKQQQIRRENG